MILFSRKDFPVPDEHTFKKKERKKVLREVTQIYELLIDREKHHECVMKGDC